MYTGIPSLGKWNCRLQYMSLAMAWKLAVWLLCASK